MSYGSAVTLLSLFIGLLTPSIVNALNSGSLYFNINAGDSGSYSSSNPTTWRDLSPTGRNGTIVNSPTFNSVTGALDFTNNTGSSSLSTNAYVDMGSGFSNFGSGITIEFEGHFGSVNQAWERIFDFGNGAESNNIWVGVLGESSNPNELAIEIFYGATGQGRCISTGQALLNNGQAGVFAKFVITLDGSKCRMYKNGSEINTAVGVMSFFNDPNDLGSTYNSLPLNVTRSNNYIARSNWPTDASFNGAIKYVRIYTEAISSSDVTNNSTSYTLTYSDSGSDSGTPPSTQTGNGFVTLASNSGNLSKANHTFIGWASSANQSTALSGSYNLTSNSTLYPVFALNTYTVTYLENGGSTVTDGSFTHGGPLTFPSNPDRAGYTFLGWFDSSSGGTPRTASSIAAANTSVTLNAQWSPNTYNVTYNEQGGTSVPDGSYEFGTTLTFPTAPTREGYSFAGWFTSPTGGSPLTAANVSSGTSDVTLHAQWTALPAQTVSWTPTNTSLVTNQSPATPSSGATTNGDGHISYSVTSSGSTGCSVNSSTGVISFSSVGQCTVRATASSTSNYLTGFREVTYSMTSSSPVLSLNLDVASGDQVANSAVDYGASGLQSNSSWTLVVRSSPQTIAAGTFTNSLVAGTAQLPAGLTAGWHSITLTGISPNGSILSHSVWFEVSSSGTMIQTSGSDPVASISNPTSLAQTGVNTGLLWLGVYLVLAGSAFVAFKRPRRLGYKNVNPQI